jgi:RNA polymerase sigma factor (sigma-70 family)
MDRTTEEMLPTRQSLLGRLKDWEDQAGWQDFFNTYWKLIYSVARKAGLHEPAAQDVVQETMIGVARAIGDFRYDPRAGSFKAWLLTITRRRIADHLRRTYAQAAHIAPESDADGEGTSLISRIPDEVSWEKLWDNEWEQNLLEVALEKVKTKVKSRQYQLFDCFVLKEWPMDEIRRKLGVSMAQVYFAKYKVGSVLQRELRNLHTRNESTPCG